MKKRICVFLVSCLILAALAPLQAYADLGRGSSGEDVASLQAMLFDMGYLSEEPDGQYGTRTETAVKEYQKTAGLEETGSVTDDLMDRIYQEWIDYQDWIAEQLKIDAENNYAPFCYTWEDENGCMITEHCQKHALLWEATEGMLSEGDAESALYSYYEWQAEVISLYNEWIDLVNEPVREELENSKALCIQLMEAQHDAMRSSYEANGTEIDPSDVYYGAELWMSAHCAWLCQMLSTLRAE